MIHIDLVHNLAVLIALTAISGLAERLLKSARQGALAQGLLFGLAAVICMTYSMPFTSGVQFDARSVAISVCGAIFGPAAALVSALVASAFRIAQGGDGTLTGVLVVAASAVLGGLYHVYAPRVATQRPALGLWGMSLAVHLVMLTLMLTLPGGLAARVIPDIALEVLVLFPATTVLLGLMLLDQQARRSQMAQLVEIEDRFRLFLRHTPAAVAMLDSEMRYLALSDRWYADYGLAERNIEGRSHYDVFPESEEEWKAVHQRCLQGATESREEDRFVRSDGRVYWIRWSIVPWRLATSEVGGIIMFTEDITERKEAEIQLAERERRYRSIFNQQYQYTVLLSPEGRILEINELPLALVNVAREDVVGEFFWDMPWWRDLPEEQAQWRGLLEDARKSGPQEVQQIRYRDSRGVIRLADTVVAAVCQDSGALDFFIVQGTDVTDSVRTREESETAKRLLESTFESMSDVVLVVDAPSRIMIRCNSAVERVLGYSAAEFTGTPTRILYPDEETYDRIGRESREALESGRTYRAEVPVRRKDGAIIHVEIAVSAIHEGADWRNGVVSVIRDVSERVRAARDLENMSKRLRDFMEFSPLAITEVTPDGRYLRLNQAAAQLLSSTPEGVVGKRFHEVLPRETAAQFMARVQEVVVGRKPVTIEDCIPLPVERHFSTTLFPLIDERGEIASIGGIAQEITERRNAEAERGRLEGQLRQAQRLESVGRLAGGVAHDFNNMLGVILGHTEMALHGMSHDDPLRSGLEEVQHAAARSADLTRQLLAFARRQTIAPKALDLNDTIESMLKMLGRLVGEDVDIQWKPGKNIPPILADPSQIDQILANLTVNARDAIEGNGTMRIETCTAEFDAAYCAGNPGYEAGSFVMLAVSDDGCGMDEDTVAQIFEPFFTTKPQGSGTGLGLATVYGIVQQNGGFLIVESALGKGTCFRLYLPVHRTQAPVAAAPAGCPSGGSGSETILLVEDESALLNLTQRMLERMGYHVLAMASPREALAAAESYQGEIHLLVTDIIMPEMNGKELQIEVEKLRPGIGALFISGYTADVIARHGALDGGVHFLQKPFKAAQLAGKVREALDESRPDTDGGNRNAE